jgi:hypothetical protein
MVQNVCKESLKSDGQPFHQYQHNEQSSFNSNQLLTLGMGITAGTHAYKNSAS